jgi:hypothetical protein
MEASRQARGELFLLRLMTGRHSRDDGKLSGTVYGIIKQSGGNIWFTARSEKVRPLRSICRAFVADSQAYKRSTEPERAAYGTETILLVEDEESVRNFLREVLENYGFRVLEDRLEIHDIPGLVRFAIKVGLVELED